MATERPKLTTRPAAKLPTREELLPLDVQNLMLDAKFRRFMLTVFETAGMFIGSFHSEAGASHWYEGRRSLGFDMLRTLRDHSGDDALIRILSEDQPKEATNGRRNQYDRNRELDDGSDVDGADSGRQSDDRTIDYTRD